MSPTPTPPPAGWEAGRALDARIAVEVMGWTLYPWSFGQAWRNGAMECVAPLNWSPSTNIAAAWLVVERLRAQGWCLSLHEEAGKSLQWVATFVRDAYGDDYEDTGEDLALTAPLAICLAALATLSPEVPRG